MKLAAFTFFAILFSTSFSIPVSAKVIQSSANQTALLELYSSEGCSSCPPAERWLNGLKLNPGLFKDFVPAAFHVTYWDYLGWRDRYAREKYDDRQAKYSLSWGERTRYTPGVVLNGKKFDSWHRTKQLPVREQAKIVGVLQLKILDEERFTMTFVPEDGDVRKGWQGHVALLGFGIRTQVRAGENFGRTLDHDFIVLNWVTKVLIKEAEGWQAAFYLPKTAGFEAADYGLAAWVTQVGDPTPVQSTGSFL